jgi:membrane protein implicated in regulation of membrane protease activity
MTRTRLVFFAILAIFLAIITASISMQIIGETLLRQFFIACTVFGAGVVMLDFMGIFGGEQGGADADGGIGGDTSGDVSGDLTVDSGDVGDSTGVDDVDAAADTDGGLNTVLSVLIYLRLFVYFCLGFGPTGLVALLTGRSGLMALLLAVPVGVISVFLAQAIFRFQQRGTDSTVRGQELLMQQATVTVPLTYDIMGRVRIQIGMSVVDQYAKAADPETEFARGETVRIVRVTEDCVYVR